MPEIKNFVVVQTSTVRVRANSARDAALIAAAAFDHGQNSDQGIAKPEAVPEGVWGNTTHAIRVTGIQAIDISDLEILGKAMGLR
jgi:hypothetical protein